LALLIVFSPAMAADDSDPAVPIPDTTPAVQGQGTSSDGKRLGIANWFLTEFLPAAMEEDAETPSSPFRPPGKPSDRPPVPPGKGGDPPGKPSDRPPSSVPGHGSDLPNE
jgi:hypothetical protein